MAKYASVDEYIAALPDDRRHVVEQLRRTVTEAAPDADEVIAYNMPALRMKGRFLASYEAYKNHYSVFPWTDRMLEVLGDDLKPFTSGKGTLKFPADQPIPLDLVRRVVELRVEELQAEERDQPNARDRGAASRDDDG